MGSLAKGVPRPYILRRIESRMAGRMEGVNRVLPV